MDKDDTYAFNMSTLISGPRAMASETTTVASGVRLSDELLNRYQTLATRLKEVTKEANALHEENEWLRLANEELTRRLVSWSDNQSENEERNDETTGGVMSPIISRSNSSMSVVTDESDYDSERFSLPKCISIPSPGYFKLLNDQCPSSLPKTPRATPSRSPFPHNHHGTKLRVRGEEKAVEIQVFNQGMYKTELCNKWQETGTCSYGDHCRFAHGLQELRPIIRHPRYKTQICRLLLTGSTCPYGHRCHFRHSVSSNTATRTCS